MVASLPVIVQETTNDATTSYVYGLDMLSATDNSDVTTYFLQDGLGSTTGLTDADGAMTATYEYDVFGAMKSQTGTSGNAWRFTGEANDTGVGRSPYYLRARYYDPAIGNACPGQVTRVTVGTIVFGVGAAGAVAPGWQWLPPLMPAGYKIAFGGPPGSMPLENCR